MARKLLNNLIKNKMPIDVVFPNGNEEEFITSAPKLGYNGLYFVYKYNKNAEYEKKIKKLIEKLQTKTRIKLYCGFIVSFKDLNKISNNKNLIFIEGSDKNRLVIEKKKVDVLFSLEKQTKEDFMHHRASGLNHVLCELSRKNNIIIGFSFNTILKNKNNSYTILGRMMQNIFLCRKYKIKTLIGSFAEKPYEMRSFYDLSSLFFILGMDKEQIKKSFDAYIIK